MFLFAFQELSLKVSEFDLQVLKKKKKKKKKKNHFDKAEI